MPKMLNMAIFRDSNRRRDDQAQVRVIEDNEIKYTLSSNHSSDLLEESYWDSAVKLGFWHGSSHCK